MATAIVVHDKKKTSRWALDNNVQADSHGDDGGNSRHKDHEESCLVFDKGRKIVKEGFGGALIDLTKIEMTMFTLFMIALFLCFSVSSIQATDHHPLQILLDDLGKQPALCLCFNSIDHFFRQTTVRVVQARRSLSSSNISLPKVVQAVVSSPSWVQKTVLAMINAKASPQVTATCCFANSNVGVLCESTIIREKKSCRKLAFLNALQIWSWLTMK
jgi:hypothetical protein